MSDPAFKIPAVVRSGVVRKIGESLRSLVDGRPSSQGTPMESEVRYYYNYYFSHKGIAFEEYLSALALETLKIFPDLSLSLDWIRQCDKMNRICSARNSLYKLRTYVQKDRYFRTSFWDILWNLTEIHMNTFRISYAEIGTTSLELKSLSWYYLLKECSNRVKKLKDTAKYPNSILARNSFKIVNDMLEGKPISAGDFCKSRDTYYSSSGAYKLYENIAMGRAICPEDVGWSAAAHLAYRQRIFPDGYSEDVPDTSDVNPTAPATAESDEQVIAHLSSLDPVSVSRSRSSAVKSMPREIMPANAWSLIVDSVMRQLPLMQARSCPA